MLKKLIFGAGMAYLARKFIGGSRRTSSDFDHRGGGLFGARRDRSGFGI